MVSHGSSVFRSFRRHSDRADNALQDISQFFAKPVGVGTMVPADETNAQRDFL